METSTLLSAQQWAEQTFGAVRLGHQRRTQPAVRMAAALATEPMASLPKQMGSEAEVHAASRFLQTAAVSYERLMEPHVQQTRAAMGQQQQVLLIQETTEVDSQQHPSTTGLGPIGNASHQGYLLQSVLAVVPSTREVLGLAHQEPFLRQPVPPTETRRHREKRERESQVWQRSVQAIGTPPDGVQWIPLGDRYSDRFLFLQECRQQHCDFVVRAAQDRCVDLLVEQADAPLPQRSHQRGHRLAQPPEHLFEVLSRWPAQAGHVLHLEASKQSKARTAHVLISDGSVRLWPPRLQETSDQRPLVVWVVRVWEPEPPDGTEPVEWVLLTSVLTQSVEQAWQRVDWYRARWLVEEYHQGLKTGCRLERRQVQTYHGLRRLLGLLAPTAVRLLQLRATARHSAEQLGLHTLPTEVVQVVAAKAGIPAGQLTTQQCWYAIARFGGYVARKGDGPPGWKPLWAGWFSIQTLLEGLHLAPRLSLDSSSGP